MFYLTKSNGTPIKAHSKTDRRVKSMTKNIALRNKNSLSLSKVKKILVYSSSEKKHYSCQIVAIKKSNNTYELKKGFLFKNVELVVKTKQNEQKNVKITNNKNVLTGIFI